MTIKAKKIPAPVERGVTIRKQIISELEGQTLSAKEISAYAGVREKEVYEHLDHIKKSLERNRLKLIIHPASCKKCGFVFKKRERINKPGKCPICHGQSIEEPLFSIK